jgi:hypothetical protein
MPKRVLSGSGTATENLPGDQAIRAYRVTIIQMPDE